MSQNTTSHAGGCMSGLAGPLLILFIGLKLTGFIDWSWWWVLAPLWVSVIIALGAICFLLRVAFLVGDRK